MSPDRTTQIAALGIEPTYSAREAAVFLGRSYSWLDQRLREGQFVRPDGTVVQPVRTPGGYRRFTPEMLKDIATSSYRQHWFSMDKLKLTFRELAMAAHRDTGEYKIPSGVSSYGQPVVGSAFSVRASPSNPTASSARSGASRTWEGSSNSVP
jgi:hypothetical protein